MTKEKDVICLNVGGTKFVTRKSTITAWTNALDVSEDTLFLDVDPNAFSILLSFMRNGSIPPSQVTEQVLKQAILFRVEGFVSMVQTFDVIVINVRGTRMETSKQLLKEFSTYFHHKLSNKNLVLELFLNQDPVAFSVLLEFMTRGGYVEQSKLTNEVLELAQVLGVDVLINAVKTRVCWVGKDGESILKFNNIHTRYISNAIRTCQGACLFTLQPQYVARVEYASVYLYKRPASARTSLRLPFRACAYGNVSPELLRMGDTINVLNRLGKEGYCLANASLQTSFSKDQNQQPVPGLGNVFSHILFCKPNAVDQARRRSSIQSRILNDVDDDESQTTVPHEFVALLRPVDELHSSNATRLAVPSSDTAPAYWAGTQLRDMEDATFHGCMAWLTNHGFAKQEAILNQAFKEALQEVNAKSEEPSGWATIMVFSKPITAHGNESGHAGAHASESLPTIIESSSITSSITDMSLENGH